MQNCLDNLSMETRSCFACSEDMGRKNFINTSFPTVV